MKIALVYGAAAPAGRLMRSLEAFEAALAGQSVETSVLDLSRLDMPWADGTPLESLAAPVREAIGAVAASDAVAVFSPVYRATAPGVLKNLFDLLPIEALEGKAVGIVSMGATPHHFLAVSQDLHPILSWFGAFSVPEGIYLTSRSFEDGALVESARGELVAYAGTLADTASRLSAMRIRPRPLAARAK